MILKSYIWSFQGNSKEKQITIITIIITVVASVVIIVIKTLTGVGVLLSTGPSDRVLVHLHRCLGFLITQIQNPYFIKQFYLSKGPLPR